MRRKWFLCAVLIFGIHIGAYSQYGWIEVTCIAKPSISEPYEKLWFYAATTPTTFGNDGFEITASTVESLTAVMNVLPGDYYVLGSVNNSKFHSAPYISPFKFNAPWLYEYYKNTSTRSGATLIPVHEGDTARVTMEFNWTTLICITTQPKFMMSINYPVTYSVDGLGYSDLHIFDWRMSDTHAIGVDEYYVYPNGDTRCHFREWRHGGSRIQNYTVPSPVFGKPADTLMARFDFQYKLMININDTTWGTVTTNPPGLWHDKNTKVSLTAVPKKGYRFVRWEKDTTRTISVTVDTSKRIWATFAPDLGPTGTVEALVYATYPPSCWSPDMHDHSKSWSITLFNTDWQVVKEVNRESGGDRQFHTIVLNDIPVGQYYLYSSAFYFYFWGGAWFPEYYNDAPEKSGATLISITKSDTTRITIELNWITLLAICTSPEPMQIIVDGVTYTAPQVFKWRQSDVHGIGVDEWIQPASQTYWMRFREWRHGGNRMQNYTVPEPKFLQITDSLIARFDYYMQLEVLSKYGHPEGSGRYKAWSSVSFSVEDSVIEYSDSTFKFLKTSNPIEKDSLLHLFDKWEGIEGHMAYSGKDNPAKFTIYGKTIEKALWKDQVPLVVSSGDTSMGTVSVIPPGLWHDRDSTVTLHAISKIGYHFIGWEGSVSDTTSLVNVKMDTSKKILAMFERLTGVDNQTGPDTKSELPLAFRLYPNFPNPFNPETELRFDVPEREQVRVVVLSMVGKRIAMLADATYEPGQYSVRWNSVDASGEKVGSGIYLCVMTADRTVQVVKMLLLK